MADDSVIAAIRVNEFAVFLGPEERFIFVTRRHSLPGLATARFYHSWVALPLELDSKYWAVEVEARHVERLATILRQRGLRQVLHLSAPCLQGFLARYARGEEPRRLVHPTVAFAREREQMARDAQRERNE